MNYFDKRPGSNTSYQTWHFIDHKPTVSVFLKYLTIVNVCLRLLFTCVWANNLLWKDFLKWSKNNSFLRIKMC